MYTPDLLTMTDGTPVTSSAQWEARRGELLNILAWEQYGAFLPPSTASARVMAPPMPACAGHAMQETLEVRFDTPAGEFAFPLRFLYPADGQVHPLFLLLNFRPLIPDIYCPAEEILDNGFALAVVCYTDITADDGDWGSGLCGHYPRKHPDTDPGKLVFWAYAASRALDVLTLRPEVDARNIAVIGHSRLGKAALLCGAQDARVRFTCANDAGCGGDALEWRAASRTGSAAIAAATSTTRKSAPTTSTFCSVPSPHASPPSAARRSTAGLTRIRSSFAVPPRRPRGSCTDCAALLVQNHPPRSVRRTRRGISRTICAADCTI